MLPRKVRITAKTFVGGIETLMKKPTSPRQLAANRRNAKSSTGPRTPQGRAISKMNAMKHGILSRQVLVRSMALQENETDLNALYQRFWEEFQPSGPLEEMLVDQIVTAHWRLRRALLAESGEISRSVDRAERKRHQGMGAHQLWTRWSLSPDPIAAMWQSSSGNLVLGEWLREMRETVETEGMLTEAALEKLASCFGGKPNFLLGKLKGLCEKFAAETTAHPEGLDAGQKERHKNEVLAFLRSEMAAARLHLERCAEQEDYDDQARQAAAILPSEEVLDKILRYETKLERQMYRAMAQLERVQRMRRGEALPAPLSVDISDRS